MCDYGRQRVGPEEAKQQKLERKRKDRLKKYLHDKNYLNSVTDYMWKVREKGDLVQVYPVLLSFTL